MRAMWSGLVVAAIVTVGLGVCEESSALAQSHREQRESLRGLYGAQVLVEVEDLAPDIKRDGLREDQIRTDVELRLRQAGIRVLTREEELRAPGTPILYIHVNAPKSRTYQVALHVQFIQDVQLSRDPMIKLGAVTWFLPSVIFKASAGKVPELRSQIADKVDEFINDYLAVNPK